MQRCRTEKKKWISRFIAKFPWVHCQRLFQFPEPAAERREPHCHSQTPDAERESVVRPSLARSCIRRIVRSRYGGAPGTLLKDCRGRRVQNREAGSAREGAKKEGGGREVGAKAWVVAICWSSAMVPRPMDR